MIVLGCTKAAILLLIVGTRIFGIALESTVRATTFSPLSIAKHPVYPYGEK